MYAQHRRSPGVLTIRRQPHRVVQHPHLVLRSAAAPTTSAAPSADQQYAPGTRPTESGGRQRQPQLSIALRAALVRARTLQQRVIQIERERDQALADAGELRLRLSRLATRLYTLQAERQAHPPAEQPNELEAILEQLKRLQGAEQHTQALEQELVRLRATVGALTHLATPKSAIVPASPRPWYRRFWFALIGKDVRAAEWSASQQVR